MDDLELLRDYANTGSSRAFAMLVERHVDLVHSAALRRVQGDAHRAKEITQMVFIDLARKATQLSRHPLLVGWFHQSTRWAAANVLRAERRRQAHEEAAAVVLEINSDPHPPAEWEALRPMLDAALDQLAESDREAILLRYFSNFSFAEVAARIGVGENAARMRVERALEKLERLLRRGGVTSSCAALATILSQNAVTAAPADLTATLAPASISAAGSAAVLGTGSLLMFKAQIAVLVVIAAAFTLGLTFETNRRKSEEAALTRIRAEQDVQRREIARLNARAAIAEQTLQGLPSIVAAPPPDPIQLERKRLDLIIRKGELDQQYTDLFRRLQLEPATLDRFKGLLVQRNQAIFDAHQVLKVENVTLASYDEEQELERDAARTIDREIQALLSHQKFAEFDRYVSTQRIRRLVSTSDLTPDSASDRRVDQLVELFERTCPDFLNQSYGSSDPQVLPDAFLDKARSIVSEETYEHFMSQQKMSEATSRMNAIARAAAYEGKLKLNKSSARLYATPPKTSAGSASPAKSP